MGCCLSKKGPCSSSRLAIPTPHPQSQQPNDLKKPQIATTQIEQKKNKIAIETDLRAVEKKEERGEEKEVKSKKEVFVIQHRKSNDKRTPPDSDGSISNSSNSTDPIHENKGIIGSNILEAAANGQVVRTSSCTKEEVDAILIQCGRLSRSSSGKGNGHGRKYSGSKRSYDFDKENGDGDLSIEVIGGDGDEDDRLRRRQSRGSHRRRTTPSRSREREQQNQQRSGSKERAQSNGRRVSRSPGRRSESPMANNGNSNSSNSSLNGNNNNGKPGKLVPVPATVTSLSMEKINNGGDNNGNVKRVLVKRNVGSPRSQSPARTNQANANGNGNGNGNANPGSQQQPSLSRSNSRKAEQSPYRRTPLNEIDMNSLPFQPLPTKKPLPNKGKELEEDVVVVKQPLNPVSQNKYAETNSGKAGTHRRTSSRGAEELVKTNYCRVNDVQNQNFEQMTEDKCEQVNPDMVFGDETIKLPQTLMRSRSSRRSRDLDINVDALLTPTPATNYNSLLLQDIQNFHQKNNSNSNDNSTSSNNTIISNINTNSPFTLPPCVTKACSILEAVADLNSSNKNDTNFSFHNGKKRLQSKDPFVESEVKVGDDLMEPSIHKYVTVRKRGGDVDDVESSGSNSFVGGGGGGQPNWASSSTWEPTSADSTDCWTSKSYTREDGFSPVGFHRQAISDFACGIEDEPEKTLSKNGREQITGTRAKTGGGRRGLVSTSKGAVVSV